MVLFSNEKTEAKKTFTFNSLIMQDLNKHRQPKKTNYFYCAEPEEQYLKDNNIYKFVNQLEIFGTEKRIPDGIVYINGLPLVVFEFKSAIREEATIYDAFKQLTVRYRRDIPELFKYNAFCVISDGVNNKQVHSLPRMSFSMPGEE
jgi:type I restriction enzyme R subunit